MPQHRFCKICGKDFIPKSNSKGIYCSLKCSYSDKERMKNLGERHRINVGNAKRGKKFTEQQKIGMRKPKSEQHKINLRLAKNGSWTGNKNPRWKGGVSVLRCLIRGCFEYRLWRSDVFKRDNYTCQHCGNNKGHNLNADHYPNSFADILSKNKIKSIEDALSCVEIWDINNGRTLCIDCHKKTKNYGKA